MVVSTREVARAQDALVAAVDDLDDAAVREPSRCEGWSRGHVLAHVARNAEGIANLATWALTGEVTPMYAAGRRDVDIEEGATRSVADVRADLVTTNDHVLAVLGELEGAVATDPTVAEYEVRLGDPEQGPAVPARRLPFLRMMEVVVHHHDLDVGLHAHDWPVEYVEAGLPWVWRRMAGRVDDPPTLVAHGPEGTTGLEPAGSDVQVAGAPADLLVWLLGRADADERGRLDVTGADGLPTLPAY